MRKTYLLLLLAAVLAACSKEGEPTLQVKERFPVTFSVTGIKKTDASLISGTVQRFSSKNPYDIVQIIDLFIYNSKGELVVEKNTSCCASSNDAFVEALQEGSYTVIAAGYWDAEKTGLSKLSTALLAQRLTDHASGEIFLAKAQFQVKAGNNEVDVVLKRQVGLLSVNITDAPTPGAFQVKATLFNTANQFRFNEFIPLYNNVNHQYQVNILSLNQLGGYFMVANNDQAYKTKVLLEVIGDSGNVLTSKLVENVTVGTNIKTTLNGKLFGVDSQEFIVEVDTEWEGANAVEF